jgi:hypothetical protein
MIDTAVCVSIESLERQIDDVKTEVKYEMSSSKVGSTEVK